MGITRFGVMNKMVAAALVVVLAGSCLPDHELKMETHYVELGHSAQEVRVKANDELLFARFDYSQSDFELREESYKDFCNVNTGDWFKLIVDTRCPRYLTVVVDENDWGRDRTILVWVYTSDEKHDSVRVVQKAKP